MKKYIKSGLTMLLACTLLFAASCKDEEVKSSACDIKSFKVAGVDWLVGDSTITYEYPEGTSITEMTPKIEVSPGATITPASGESRNFFNADVKYTVFAENGASKVYIARARIESAPDDCRILEFKVDTTHWNINDTLVTCIYGFVNTEICIPIISIPFGAKIDPPSGRAQNFFIPEGVTYTVTARDGVTTKRYNARAFRSKYEGTAIYSINAGLIGATKDPKADLNGRDTTWAIIFTEYTLIGKLAPVFAMDQGATIDPPSGSEQDFSGERDVIYTVTAESGAKQQYVVRARVEIPPSTIAKIDSIELFGRKGFIEADSIIVFEFYTEHKVDLSQPATPVVYFRGESFSPTGAQDFSGNKEVQYTVTAEDGSQKTYTVKAIQRKSNDCGAVFTVSGAETRVSGQTVTFIFPKGTTPNTSIVPNIKLTSTLATIDPDPKEPKDFFAESGVQYIVTAEDGTTKTYAVRARIAGTEQYEWVPPAVRQTWTVDANCGIQPWGSEGSVGGNTYSAGNPMLVLDNNHSSGWHTMSIGWDMPMIVIDMKVNMEISAIRLSNNHPDDVILHDHWRLKELTIYLSDVPIDPNNTESWAALTDPVGYWNADEWLIGVNPPYEITLPTPASGRYLILNVDKFTGDEAKEAGVSLTEVEIKALEN
jgi:hypothetical protein